MSDFSQLLTDTGEASLMLLHGDAGRFTYTTPGGDPTTYDAIIGPEEAVRHVDNPGLIVGYDRAVSVRVADLATVNMSGTATVDGVAYSISSAPRSSGGFWELSLHRTAAVEVSRPNYRRTR